LKALALCVTTTMRTPRTYEVKAFCFVGSVLRRFENSTLRVLTNTGRAFIDTSTALLTSVVASRAPPRRNSGVGWQLAPLRIRTTCIAQTRRFALPVRPETLNQLPVKAVNKNPQTPITVIDVSCFAQVEVMKISGRKPLSLRAPFRRFPPRVACQGEHVGSFGLASRAVSSLATRHTFQCMMRSIQ